MENKAFELSSGFDSQYPTRVQVALLREFGLNPEEWKRTYSVNEGQRYFFIWDKKGDGPLAGFYCAKWGFCLSKDDRRVAFVRV